MQPSRKRQISIAMPEELLQALGAEAKKRDRSMSYIAERAIRQYLGLPATGPLQNPSDPDLEEGPAEISPDKPWPRS